MSTKRELEQLTEQLTEVSHQLNDVIERLDEFESALLGNLTKHESMILAPHSLPNQLQPHCQNHRDFHPEAGP